MKTIDTMIKMRRWLFFLLWPVVNKVQPDKDDKLCAVNREPLVFQCNILQRAPQRPNKRNLQTPTQQQQQPHHHTVLQDHQRRKSSGSIGCRFWFGVTHIQLCHPFCPLLLSP
jgi:hypothetical protein